MTGKVLPDGEIGEIVITTLQKEGAPLLRYRTHDLSRILPGRCACGSRYPRLDTIMGRTDDMIKVKGVNIFPSQIEELLSSIAGVSSEYRLTIEHLQGRDHCILSAEAESGADAERLRTEVQSLFKTKIGITVQTEITPLGTLPRSEKKTKRVIDNRD